MKPLEVGHILYTRDGRKSGNLTVVWVGESESLLQKDQDGNVIDIWDTTEVWVVSDYGNLIKTKMYILSNAIDSKQYFATYGKTTSTHKYHNYRETHPEEFI